MFPFIEIGSFKLPMYGLCIATGAVIAVLIAMKRAKKGGVIDPDDLLYCIVYSALAALVGAKLLYALTSLKDITANASYYFGSFSGFLKFMQYGFVFYGGLIGGLIVFLLYVRKHHMDVVEMISLVIPVVPLVHSIGRIGCFCAGCCYGVEMAPPWGLYFSEAGVCPSDVPHFPVQLLEAALNMLLFILLFNYTKKKRGAGKVLGLYLSCYAVERFILEFFRADAERGVLFGVSTSQWIGLLLLPLGLVLFFAKYDKLSRFYYSKWNKVPGDVAEPADAEAADVESSSGEAEAADAGSPEVEAESGEAETADAESPDGKAETPEAESTGPDTHSDAE